MAQPQNPSNSALQRYIYRVSPDGALAHTIYSLALKCQQGARRGTANPTQLPLPVAAAGRGPGVPVDARSMAYDLAVHLAFLRPEQAERACHLLGPAAWRVVQRLGGWRALHRLPQRVKAQGLGERVAGVLGQLGPRTRPRPSGQRALNLTQATALIEQWRPQLPSLGPADAARLVRGRLGLGGAALLLDRLAAAVEEDRVPAEHASAALWRMCERCPALGG